MEDKKKKYLLTGLISLAIICMVFITKKIFPFGGNSIIWSDMHEQVTAIYYKFYDAIRGSDSIFVDFTSGGGLNFIGVIAYYILSPFTLVLLFFPRNMVVNAVSIVVALKIIASSLTALYFISKTFKKIKTPYSILLSLLYAFSSYTLVLYIITAWMDAVYLLPLLIVGLKKILDLEDNKMYIIILSVCLVCSFYISFMILLYIILASLIYLYIYKKENRKKAIFNLGVSTVISLLISSIVVIPTMLQIASSERAGFDLSVIINSKFGPLSDKLSFFFTSAIAIVLTVILLLNYKKHKKFSLFAILNLAILAIPVIMEPVNKMWHFGSYVYFPYRYGFLMMFFLLIISCYVLENIDSMKSFKFKFGNYLAYLSLAGTFILMTIIIYKYRIRIFKVIDRLSLTKDKTAFLLVLIVFVATVVTAFLIITQLKNKKISLYILGIIIILFNSYLYIGGYDPEGILKKQYKQMLNMNAIKGVTNNYYIKEVSRNLISNYGMVSGINTYSNFTSLTDKTNFMTMQRLGYDSYWMDTESIGGNLFTDIVLAQKYIVTEDEYNDLYYKFLNEEKDLKYYEFNSNMPYGYKIIGNASLENSKNSFEASNIVYNSITGKENIFDIETLYESKEDLDSYPKDEKIKKEISVQGKKRIYLEIFTAFDSVNKCNNYNAFDVYVNGTLKYASVPNSDRNGALLLGDYENENVTIEIVSIKKAMLNHITVGELDLNKLDDFIETYYDETYDVKFNGNSITINAEGREGEMLFLPITYLDGYFSNTNEIFRVYDNFLGIKLHDGENTIEVVYVPKGIIIGAVLSLLGIVLAIVWIKYLQTMSIPLLENIVYYIYLAIYVLVVLIFYILMPIMFIKSFI